MVFVMLKSVIICSNFTICFVLYNCIAAFWATIVHTWLVIFPCHISTRYIAIYYSTWSKLQVNDNTKYKSIHVSDMHPERTFCFNSPWRIHVQLSIHVLFNKYFAVLIWENTDKWILTHRQCECYFIVNVTTAK